MERVRLSFVHPGRPGRSGALVLDDDGRVQLRASPALAAALNAAVADPATDLAPLHFDDWPRGLTFAASLVKGVRVDLLQFELVSGGLEVRAYIGRGWVHLTFEPGDFDPDAAWEFVLTANETRLELPRT